jgi:hypothetical protein
MFQICVKAIENRDRYLGRIGGNESASHGGFSDSSDGILCREDWIGESPSVRSSRPRKSSIMNLLKSSRERDASRSWPTPNFRIDVRYLVHPLYQTRLLHLSTANCSLGYFPSFPSSIGARSSLLFAVYQQGRRLSIFPRARSRSDSLSGHFRSYAHPLSRSLIKVRRGRRARKKGRVLTFSTAIVCVNRHGGNVASSGYRMAQHRVIRKVTRSHRMRTARELLGCFYRRRQFSRKSCRLQNPGCFKSHKISSGLMFAAFLQPIGRNCGEGDGLVLRRDSSSARCRSAALSRLYFYFRNGTAQRSAEC